MENPIKVDDWGYSHFRKPPYTTSNSKDAMWNGTWTLYEIVIEVVRSCFRFEARLVHQQYSYIICPPVITHGNMGKIHLEKSAGNFPHGAFLQSGIPGIPGIPRFRTSKIPSFGPASFPSPASTVPRWTTRACAFWCHSLRPWGPRETKNTGGLTPNHRAHRKVFLMYPLNQQFAMENHHSDKT